MIGFVSDHAALASLAAIVVIVTIGRLSLWYSTRRLKKRLERHTHPSPPV